MAADERATTFTHGGGNKSHGGGGEKGRGRVGGWPGRLQRTLAAGSAGPIGLRSCLHEPMSESARGGRTGGASRMFVPGRRATGHSGCVLGALAIWLLGVQLYYYVSAFVGRKISPVVSCHFARVASCLSYSGNPPPAIERASERLRLTKSLSLVNKGSLVHDHIPELPKIWRQSADRLHGRDRFYNHGGRWLISRLVNWR